MDEINEILELARWAPSGDNTQPWRFERIDARRLVIHGFDTRAHCVYDLHGRASQLSLGALLQTLIIAASQYRLVVHIERHGEISPETPTFSIRFSDEPELKRHELFDYIEKRSTQRRPMRLTPILDSEKVRLAEAAGPEFAIRWWTSSAQRLSMARLLMKNSYLRLITPEAFEVHRSVIEWQAQFSETRIPDQALGLDPVGRRLTQWVMRDWKRMHLVNSIPGGTLFSRFQLDFFPSIFCAGHFVLVASNKPETIDDFVNAGMAVQRVWLTLTALNLWQQPEMTPLIFSSYVRDGTAFTKTKRAQDLAIELKNELGIFMGKEDAERAVWMGRVGAGRAPSSRSVRLSVLALSRNSGYEEADIV
jgi:hypothetical protein